VVVVAPRYPLPVLFAKSNNGIITGLASRQGASESRGRDPWDAGRDGPRRGRAVMDGMSHATQWLFSAPCLLVQAVLDS
jgi:hypothetical protein